MKILLVDDERTEREGIRFLIEKFQFELEVAEAANGICKGKQTGCDHYYIQCLQRV